MSNWGKAFSDTKDYLSDTTTHTATGFPSLDGLLPRGGLRPGHVALVIARPEVGKSAWAGQVLVNAARAGVPSLYVSAEMVTAEVVTRMLSSYLDKPMLEVEETIVGTSLDPAMLAANATLKLVSVLDKAEPTWEDVARVLHSIHPRPQVVVLDHLQLMGADKYTKAGDRVAAIAKRAKSFAKDHHIAIIMLHQVARASISNEPVQIAPGQFTQKFPFSAKNHGDVPLSAEDGFQSGEMDADFVIGLYRPEKRPGQAREFYDMWKDRLVVQLLKNRHGLSDPKGLVATWHRPSMFIEETMSMADFEQVQQTITILGQAPSMAQYVDEHVQVHMNFLNGFQYNVL